MALLGQCPHNAEAALPFSKLSRNAKTTVAHRGTRKTNAFTTDAAPAGVRHFSYHFGCACSVASRRRLSLFCLQAPTVLWKCFSCSCPIASVVLLNATNAGRSTTAGGSTCNQSATRSKVIRMLQSVSSVIATSLLLRSTVFGCRATWKQHLDPIIPPLDLSATSIKSSMPVMRTFSQSGPL